MIGQARFFKGDMRQWGAFTTRILSPFSFFIILFSAFSLLTVEMQINPYCDFFSIQLKLLALFQFLIALTHSCYELSLNSVNLFHIKMNGSRKERFAFDQDQTLTHAGIRMLAWIVIVTFQS